MSSWSFVSFYTIFETRLLAAFGLNGFIVSFLLLARPRAWDVKVTERNFSRCFTLYAMMWVGSGTFIGLLYSWDPTFFVMIPFLIYSLEHYAISLQTTIFFFWCIVFQVVRIAALWIPLGFVKSGSKGTLQRLRRVAFEMPVIGLLKAYRCKLRECKAFALNAGGLYEISVKSVLTFVYFSTMHKVAFIG